MTDAIYQDYKGCKYKLVKIVSYEMDAKIFIGVIYRFKSLNDMLEYFYKIFNQVEQEWEIQSGHTFFYTDTEYITMGGGIVFIAPKND